MPIILKKNKISNQYLKLPLQENRKYELTKTKHEGKCKISKQKLMK